MVRFSEKETVKIVELYRRHECLWNPNNDHYKVKSVKQAACEDIAREMDIEDFTAADVRQKLKILRGTYNLERQKIKRLRAQGDRHYITNMKWFPLMDSFIRNVKYPQTNRDNSASENAECKEASFTDESVWEPSEGNEEDESANEQSMPTESEVEQSIRSISEPETPERQNLQTITNSRFYAVIPEIRDGQSVANSQVVTVTPEILTVKAVANSETTPATSGDDNATSVSNPSVSTVTSGIQTVKPTSNSKIFAIIPEVQSPKSVSNSHYATISSGSRQIFKSVGASQAFKHADPCIASRKRRNEEVTSTNSNHEVHQKTRVVADDFGDDEMGAFGHFVALSLKKMSMHSALSAQTEILAILTRHRLNDSGMNSQPTQIFPCILTNGNSQQTQNPVLLQKVFLKS